MVYSSKKMVLNCKKRENVFKVVSFHCGFKVKTAYEFFRVRDFGKTFKILLDSFNR